MTLHAHSNWETAAFDRSPRADAIGPFASRSFLQTWWEARGTGELLLVENGDALLPLMLDNGTARFVGEADLFDYHTPLGNDATALVADWASTLRPGTALDFDSLPGEVADEVMTGLAKAGLEPVAVVHESAAILDLPGDYDGYLAQLDKKQRHETRRKGRRFNEMLGPARLVREAGRDAVARFAAMHRLADGRKGHFMSADMEDLFGGIHDRAGGLIDFLYGDGPDPVAAAFGFEDAHGYYLYNSAYDPDAGAASPGIVLVTELLRQAIAAGLSRFDFLKGDEVYKYRLGATARPLWRVTATAGGAP